MRRKPKTLQDMKALIANAMRDKLCKAVLIELYLCGATASHKRMSVRELARRLKVHHFMLVRLWRGDRTHKAKLRYLVWFPEKRSKKGIYLSKAGLTLAKALVEEKNITDGMIAKAAREAMKSQWHPMAPIGTKMAPNGTRMAPNGTSYTNTLITLTHYENTNSLITSAQEQISKPSTTGNEERQDQESDAKGIARKRCECEMCHEFKECTKFRFQLSAPEILDLAPSAARFRNAWLCQSCERIARGQLIEAYKILTEKRGEK